MLKNNESGSLLVTALFAIIFLGIIATFISIYNKNFPPITETEQVTLKATSPSSKSINSPSPSLKTETTENHVRIDFNFNQILSNQFRKINFPEYAIELAIPKESSIQILDKEHSEDKALLFGSIHIEARSSEGTEVFDGLLIKFSIFENTEDRRKSTFEEKRVLNEQENHEFKILNIKPVDHKTFGNNNYIVINHCCYGGVTPVYYKNSEKYIYEFVIYSHGPDEDNFTKIANEILKQSTFTE